MIIEGCAMTLEYATDLEINPNVESRFSDNHDDSITQVSAIGEEISVSHNSNATPSAFGWEFQFNAAIVIMLNAMPAAKEVKVEGEVEDIEVFLNDGKKIFAQAKSCMTPEDATNALRDLKKALGTLSAASQTGHAQSLFFVTNRPDPFKIPKTIHRFSNGYSCVPYSDLPDTCKNRIEEIIQKQKLSLEKEKLSVLVFDFSGEGSNRYRIVKQRIAEFLVSLGDNYGGWAQKAMERWQLSFGKNASSKSKRITKQEMIWPLIVWMCERGTHEWLQDFDEATCDQISSTFGKMINETSERFEFVTKVMSDFALFQKQNSGLTQKEVTKKFITEKSMSFREEFDLSGLDANTAKAIMELTVEKVLRERVFISKMKKAVNL